MTNLSVSDAVQIARDYYNRGEAELDDRIDVIEGDFASLDFPDASFDLAWSQEAILHSGDRDKVCQGLRRRFLPVKRVSGSRHLGDAGRL